MIKSDFLALVRIKLYEKSTAVTKFWEDADIYALADEELRSLPAKNIYLEEIQKTTVTDDKEYGLPSGTFKVESVEYNNGTTTKPDWIPVVGGWDTFANTLTFTSAFSTGSEVRIKIKKSFTPLSTLATGDALDISDYQIEALVTGTVLRAYSALMGYFVDLQNWDYNAKPDGISYPQVQVWTREIKNEYLDVVRNVKKTPLPRFINLTD